MAIDGGCATAWPLEGMQVWQRLTAVMQLNAAQPDSTVAAISQAAAMRIEPV